MSRVLLFTLTGSERPKMAMSYGKPKQFERIPEAMRQYGIEQQALALKADRWWLVECESADAGRAAIAGLAWDFKKRQPANGDGQEIVIAGRVLASGGKP